jgi:DNA helicase II / ATP-dependent DNA helicase PcrA
MPPGLKMLLDLTDGQKSVLELGDHLLVTGGPGSGKTTISILKAAKVVREELRREQRVLFLSFARATVSRVLEAIKEEPSVTPHERQKIEVETYHSFFWQIIATHGYLIGLPRRLTILTPPNEAIALSAIRTDYPSAAKMSAEQKTEKTQRENDERWHLAREEGKVCFELFATCVTQLFEGSEKIRRLVSNRYPVIVLDEFQDTNAGQWSAVRALGEFSRLIALADPEQRIYDFIGADPERLEHFKAAFAPSVVDLSTDNHRSKGTEIALFGNDLLFGKFRKNSYAGVEFELFEPNPGQAFSKLRVQIMGARTRLIEAGKPEWSLAVLVPTKKMVRLVSDQLRVVAGQLPIIRHAAAVDMEGAILAAEAVSYLMQPDAALEGFVELVRAYFRGKNGDTPTKAALAESERIRSANAKWEELRAAGKPLPQASILNALMEVFEAAKAVDMTGDPDADWRTVRDVLENGHCPRLNEIGTEVRNVRLLDRGTILRQALAADWRQFGAYRNALQIIRRAFVEEHFASTRRPETGVIVMNMHKAKGKQFDEVIIFEGWPKRVGKQIVANPDRIVRSNERTGDMGQARQNFRVSVTRAKVRTTILTPKGDPSVLLLPANDQ